MTTAQQVLDQARAWIGLKESDGSYYEVLNTYNGHKPLARGYAIKPGDSWCDAFVSAVAIKAGAADLIGTEVGCEQHVAIFKQKGIWQEDGTITPRPGDIILFDWDTGAQPNNGYSDHIGYVESVSGGVITTIEGNKSDAVGRRQPSPSATETSGASPSPSTAVRAPARGSNLMTGAGGTNIRTAATPRRAGSL